MIKKVLLSSFLMFSSNLIAQESTILKHDYSVFETKCSQCHSISRPLDSDKYILPSQIHKLIDDMSAKPGANISSNQQKEIYDFLAYYMAIKKTDLLKQALENLPQGQADQEVQELKTITEKFK